MIENITDRLRLMRTPGIGPVTYRQLIARFGTASEALAAVPDLARRGGGRPPRLFGLEEAEREIVKVEKFGARYLALGQGLYPRLLAELEDAPPLLIAKGDLNLLDRMTVAIVGARNASAAACRFARGLAHELGQHQLIVASGLARGIDSAAHDGALETGTIGVIAGGIDNFYPPENEAAEGVIRAWAGACRNAARYRAAGPPLPIPQPNHRRDERGNRRSGGRAEIGFSDHG